MQATLKRPPTVVELYARLHTEQYTQEYITPKVAKVHHCTYKVSYHNIVLTKFPIMALYLQSSYHGIILTKFPIMAFYLQSFLL
uniref:Uncharacterized protein n=1 Tax=Lactuca sativa TaxID=4236 RepID=A0A9R1WCR6_LACSA|nr:hypothetical protein LSAT_V11C200068240 [Lactuca sativa]